ncbi:alpha/beta hydrolase family protein [Nocardiopsis sp. NPDC058631]|uniref:alpha/beta hydrolase family protein n=1 Tax=Nocardiopsis sp. NPDC058631 TaxID=3346566 RepID=UPI0036663394
MTRTGSTARKRLLAYGSAALVLAATFSAPAAITAATDPGSVVLTPPEPTGPHTVGRTELHLLDPGRGHPWVEGADDRDLTVSVWYPAEDGGEEHAPYVTRSLRGPLRSQLEQLGLHRDTVDFESSRTNALLDADAAAGAGPFPVVLFSPGFRMTRFLNTSNAEELASHGYAVVSVDHTYETPAVDLPDGRVIRTRVPDTGTATYQEAIAVRTEDIRFVLDQVAELAGGGNPDVNGRTLPAGLVGALDLDAVGMFGHSAGGLTTAEAMLVDDRIDAGIDLDGTLAYHTGDGVWADSTLEGADRPFAILGAGLSGIRRLPHNSEYNEAFQRFVQASSAPVLELYTADAEHMGYTDHQWILPAIAGVHRPDSNAWHEATGTALGPIDPGESVRTQRAYITAFFDAHLLGEDAPLLDGPSADFPAVEFVEQP